MDYLTGRLDNTIRHIFEPREAVNRKGKNGKATANSGKWWGLNLTPQDTKEMDWWRNKVYGKAKETDCFVPIFPFITQDTDIGCSILVSEIFTILAL